MSNSPAKGLLSIHGNGTPYIDDVAAALYVKAVNHIWAATTADPEGKVRETELAIKDLERCQEIVRDPDHYKRGGMRASDVIAAMLTPEQHIGFWLGNAFKYLWRCLYKHNDLVGQLRDIEKAIECLQRLKGVLLLSVKDGDADGQNS